MTRTVFWCAAVLVAASTANAHTLDEYVQALRVGVSGSQLTLHLDLTPGANIAQDIIRRVDADGDGMFSPAEAEAYGRAVIADLTVAVDDRPTTVSLVRVEVPVAGDMRDGQSIIRIEATARASSASGVHRVTVHNAHTPALSVYLANALLPDSPAVRIVRQSRDARQQTFHVDFEVEGRQESGFQWLLLAGVGLAVLITVRRA